MPRTKANNITPACSAKMTFSLRLMGRVYRKFATVAQALALVLCLSAPAFAQVAFDAVSEFAHSGSATSTHAHTTSGSNRALLVCVAYDTATQQSTSVTYNGASMTLVNRRQNNYGGPARTLEWWALSNPTVGANNIVVNKSNSTPTWTGAISVTGAHQTTASLTGAVSGTNDNPSISVTSAVGEFVVDCMTADFPGAQGTPPVPGSGQTLRTDLTTGGGFPQWYVTSTEAGAASVTMDWTTDGDRNMHIGFSVKPPAGGGDPPSAAGRRRIQ